ncbi:hypothetical protein AD006_01205 [Pseudonocardia sp. EC080610-09]|uniref:hypothetical protein n=1 Tax=unclassified Pseudonocardia TaxID=2619320 RepID=UPI0006CB62FB|nr:MULTISPECIES: hypothetical protein [unclassified Pseudonocardia]ALE74942.1 hypothetical protein FRP1_22015 [Pseudonocardia sp. EC080625-04]ALL74284.1 hypothetical protein AD006_01205 [Pseudonocardia sp. EC080610-09]ALL81307.1 hypothetical protein AD017_09030 [Pseudonocardia sp. EC080619-01]
MLPKITASDPTNIPGDLQDLAEGIDEEFERIESSVPTATPGRLLAASYLTSYTTNGMSATVVARVSASVTAGRLYRVGAWNIPVFANNYGRARMEIRYGTTPPTTSSTMIAGGQCEIPAPSDWAWSVDCVGLWAPSTNHTAHFAMILVPQLASTFVRVAGSDTWPLAFFIEDLGVDPGV